MQIEPDEVETFRALMDVAVRAIGQALGQLGVSGLADGKALEMLVLAKELNREGAAEVEKGTAP